jgi:hypothetical protein
MPGKPPHPQSGRAGTRQRSGGETPLPKAGGRPKGDPSTMGNVRSPLPSGAAGSSSRPAGDADWPQASRGMRARRALELFLAVQASDDASGGEESAMGLSLITAIVAHNKRGASRLSHITGTRIEWRPSGRLLRRDHPFLQVVR